MKKLLIFLSFVSLPACHLHAMDEPEKPRVVEQEIPLYLQPYALAAQNALITLDSKQLNNALFWRIEIRGLAIPMRDMQGYANIFLEITVKNCDPCRRYVYRQRKIKYKSQKIRTLICSSSPPYSFRLSENADPICCMPILWAIWNTDLGFTILERKRNYDFIKLLLENGETPNVLLPGLTPPLSYVANKPCHHHLIKLLLQFGANPNMVDAGNTPLMIACQNHFDTRKIKQLLRACDISKIENTRDFLQLLIKHDSMGITTICFIRDAKHYPRYSKKELAQAQKRARAVLWALKNARPQLPKDLIPCILSSNEELLRDACCTPLKLHTTRYDRVPFMPLPIIRVLVQRGALELPQTIAALKKHKYEQLLPHLKEMIDSSPADYAHSQIDSADPESVERMLGDEIYRELTKDCTGKVAEWQLFDVWKEKTNE